MIGEIDLYELEVTVLTKTPGQQWIYHSLISGGSPGHVEPDACCGGKPYNHEERCCCNEQITDQCPCKAT